LRKIAQNLRLAIDNTEYINHNHNMTLLKTYSSESTKVLCITRYTDCCKNSLNKKMTVHGNFIIFMKHLIFFCAFTFW